MAPPGSSFVILCEDVQHEAFVRRALKHLGIQGIPRVERAPGGRGSGEQWVRNRYPVEVKALRNGHVERTLIVTVDADTQEVEQRLREFDDALKTATQAPREATDRIVFVIPRRNIETWLAALSGEAPQVLDETRLFPRYAGSESACDPMARQLADHCKRRKPIGQPSLAATCVEWRRVFS